MHLKFKQLPELCCSWKQGYSRKWAMQCSWISTECSTNRCHPCGLDLNISKSVQAYAFGWSSITGTSYQHTW